MWDTHFGKHTFPKIQHPLIQEDYFYRQDFCKLYINIGTCNLISNLFQHADSEQYTEETIMPNALKKRMKSCLIEK